MKLQIVLLALCGVSAALAEVPPFPFAATAMAPPPAQKETVELYFEQIVDHFRPVDTRKWNQRYFMRNNSYQAGGPIFLFLVGEWDSTGGYISNTSFVGRMVDDFGGMAFELEHRYYGTSLPVPNFETENLEFLSTDQTLADAAQFALKMNELHNFTGPWIVCGTSYSGMLAGYARQKYSHIFHAAYSSSGQMEAKTDFFEYHEVTGAVLGEVNPLCPGYLAAAMDEFVALVEGQQPEDLQYIINSFGICKSSDLTKLEDAQYLYVLIANSFASVVQFAFPNNIEGMCTQLMDGGGTPLQNLADVIKSLIPLKCLYIDYEGAMEFYRNITEPFPGNNLRQFYYQTCTEYGWFFTLSGNSPFGNVAPVEFFIKTCSDVFGPQFTAEVLEAGVARTNLEYGGKSPDVTRVLFTHGTFDGWKKVAAEQTFGESAIVIMIEDVGHSADMFYFEEDPPHLLQARIDVSNQIKLWIDEFKNQ